MSLQATIAKLMLKLPDGMLRAMSGGRPVSIGGRTLDARYQFLAHAAKGQPPMSALTPEQARAGLDAAVEMFAPPLPAGATFSEIDIPLKGRTLKARLYRSGRQDPRRPMTVYFHMGGGVIGSPHTCHWFCALLSKTMNAPVLSVDYRLAPEHPYPAANEDAVDAYLWALEHATDWGAPARLAGVGGDSMGGYLAAYICQEMKRRGQPQPVVQLLVYPAVHVADDHPSMRLFGDAYPLTTDTMEWFMGHFLPEGIDPNDPKVSPAASPDLSGLAPALVFTAGFDPLVDQGKAYARRLSEAGVDADYHCFSTLAHGFTAFTGAVPAAKAACIMMAEQTAATVADMKL